MVLTVSAAGLLRPACAWLLALCALHPAAPALASPAPTERGAAHDSHASRKAAPAHPPGHRHKAQTPQAASKTKAKAAPKHPAAPARQKTASPRHKPEAGVTRPFTDAAGVLDWGREMALRQGLDAQRVQSALQQAKFLPMVQQLVLPPATPLAKNWAAYRERFIEPRRIQAGMRFWQRHQQALERAEQHYGVPASIVVGIIGVETLYGENTGRFRVLDALATLAFEFPSAHPRAAERQRFFRDELEHFLRMTLEAGMDPLQVRGSYAGAMGLPQFMPSSWMRHAVDFDGDGRIDLFNSPSDAIGSVANYFRAHQWQPGQPTHFAVTVVPGQTDLDTLLAPDILPTFSVESFTAKGAQLEGAALQHPGQLALIELRNGEGAPSYVAGTENFYVVTRYNWSSYYAMAVIELGQAVAQRMAR